MRERSVAQKMRSGPKASYTLPQVPVQGGIRPRIDRRIGRNAARLHRHIGQPGQRQQLRQMGERRGVLEPAGNGRGGRCTGAGRDACTATSPSCGRASGTSTMTGMSARSAAFHSHSAVPSVSQDCFSGVLNVSRIPSMPGWLRQRSSSAASVPPCTSTPPATANSPGYGAGGLERGQVAARIPGGRHQHRAIHARRAHLRPQVARP